MHIYIYMYSATGIKAEWDSVNHLDGKGFCPTFFADNALIFICPSFDCSQPTAFLNPNNDS